MVMPHHGRVTAVLRSVGGIERYIYMVYAQWQCMWMMRLCRLKERVRVGWTWGRFFLGFSRSGYVTIYIYMVKDGRKMYTMLYPSHLIYRHYAAFDGSIRTSPLPPTYHPLPPLPLLPPSYIYIYIYKSNTHVLNDWIAHSAFHIPVKINEVKNNQTIYRK